MKCQHQIIFLAAMPFVLLSCSSSINTSNDESSAPTAVVETSNDDVAESESAIGTTLNSHDRKMIKTADMKLRVDDVYKATQKIEAAVAALNGMVAASNFQNGDTETRLLPYSSDSLKQVTSYTTTSHLSVRIPSNQIDSFMSKVGTMASFIDTRGINIEDATLQYLSNDLKNKASKDAVAASKNNNEFYQSQRENSVDRKIENLAIIDQTVFSTINIDLYQPQRIDALIVPNIDNLMRASFASQIKNAFLEGFQLFKLFLVGLTQIWIFIIVGLAVFFFVKRKKILMRLK